MHSCRTFRAAVPSQRRLSTRPQCSRVLAAHQRRAQQGETPTEGNKGLREIIKFSTTTPSRGPLLVTHCFSEENRKNWRSISLHTKTTWLKRDWQPLCTQRIQIHIVWHNSCPLSRWQKSPISLDEPLVHHPLHQGRPVLIFELHRSLLQENGEVDSLAKLAQRLEMASADCLCLSTDRSSSEGLKDLFTVSRSVKIPVLARDWYIHPLQVRSPSFLPIQRSKDAMSDS